ncbi:tRNA (adenosine(37)-N6)-threonylcarbamoyltransferase complex ATPase subunit type 1 TsaE [bacterium]|nr:MAG: tRNA (adenosine(37)-N6)-threonylcarbamoyltransferase complex ATPase subunit type 1 TsaE [bacterium]
MLLGTISTIEDISQIAQKVKEILSESDFRLLFLSGELGAGKTTFAKSFLKLLDITDEVTSPTFVYLKEYLGNYLDEKVNISHYDLYRINESTEDDEKLQILNQISFLDNIGNNFVLVEWPERIESLISNSLIKLPNLAKLQIIVNHDNSRIFELSMR